MFGLGFRGALGEPCESSCDQSYPTCRQVFGRTNVHCQYKPAKRIKFIVTQDATNAQCKANATGFGWWLGVQHGHAVAKVIKHQTHQRHKQQLTLHNATHVQNSSCSELIAFRMNHWAQLLDIPGYPSLSQTKPCEDFPIFCQYVF